MKSEHTHYGSCGTQWKHWYCPTLENEGTGISNPMDKLTQYNVTNVAYTLSHITHTEFSSERELRKLIRNSWKSKPAWTFDILLIWLNMRRAGNSVECMVLRTYSRQIIIFPPSSLRLPMVEWNVALALPLRGVPKPSEKQRTGQKSDELRPRGHYGHASKRGAGIGDMTPSCLKNSQRVLIYSTGPTIRSILMLTNDSWIE